ncbi:hypothetical protein, partial [uncultured Cyclobacterium sp.]|uniref:hypothetical protein n=1 Tax=uncultured Cyclobacterium sp. TaxID=453820 RepID=UPI0030ED7C5C
KYGAFLFTESGALVITDYTYTMIWPLSLSKENVLGVKILSYYCRELILKLRRISILTNKIAGVSCQGHILNFSLSTFTYLYHFGDANEMIKFLL